MKRLFILFCITMFLFPAIAFSTPLEIDAISSFDVYGYQLQGMNVQVDVASGDSFDGTWGSNGVSGGSGDNAWSLSFVPVNSVTSSFSKDWKLSAGSDAQINSFTIDAYGAFNFFDIFYYEPETVGPAWEGTTGSNVGWFSNLHGTIIEADKVYGYSSYTEPGKDDTPFYYEFTNPVNLAGSTAVGDLWTTLKIDFINIDSSPTQGTPTGTAFTNGIFAFDADTDVVEGEERPVVPEPATMMLFGLGLLGICAVGRKRS